MQSGMWSGATEQETMGQGTTQRRAGSAGRGMDQRMMHGGMGSGMMGQHMSGGMTCSGMMGSGMIQGDQGAGMLFGSRVRPMMNLSVEDVRDYLALQLQRL